MLKQALLGSLSWLAAHQEEVNRLNVFPVPDGDTGTNMLLTLQSAVEDIKDSRATEVGKIARITAHGALMGARGNSGVILSQIFRGFGNAVQNKTELNPAELANAIGLLAQTHDYVIVDTPSRLSEDTLAILDAASVILIVITYQGSTIANTRSAIDTFEALGYKGQKPLLLVVNQSDLTAGLSKGGMEHALNLPVVGEIPSDWKLVSESNNKQTPFVLANANAPVSQAIANLATALVSQQRKR